MSQVAAINITAGPADVLKAGQAIFEYRRGVVNDPDPKHRHAMMFKDWTWANLPASEKMYYCDMAASALVSMGYHIPVMPTFTG